MPIHSALDVSRISDTTSTVRLGNRSAATPPHGDRSSDGTPNASSTPPSPALVPVISRASQPRAMVCAVTARNTKRPLVHSNR